MSRGSVPTQLLTVEELAAMLKTSRKSVYSMVERGQIPRPCIFRIGRLLRFRESAIQAWIGNHGEGQKP